MHKITADKVLEILDRDDRNRLKVKHPNGNGGIVFRDSDYYPEEATYRIEIHEGWAGGVTETICDAGDRWIATNYLKDAEVYMDMGDHWMKVEVTA